MKNKHGEKITENTIVRLREDVSRQKGRRDSARVIGWLDGIEGGVQLDIRLDGFHYWNIDDLEAVPGRNA